MAEETTNPIDGRDMDAVAASLLETTVENPTEPEPEAVEATDVDQTETEEVVEQEEDAIEASDDGEEYSDDEEYEVAEEPEVEQEPLYTVKVNGEERQVDLAELTRGYSGQKYIQEGMANVATQKKEAERIQQEATQERQALMQLMKQVQAEGVPPTPEYPSEELRSSDPIGFLEKEAEYRRAVDKRQQFEQQARAVAQREAQEQQRLNDERLSQEAIRLAEWMPEFNNPEKKAEIIQDMTVKAKKHYNLTDEMIGTVQTAEEVRILNDALKWRELQTSKSKAEKKVEGARKVVKPAAKRAASAGRVSQAKKARSQMEKTGSVDDVAKFLLS